MDDTLSEQLATAATRLATAAEALESLVSRLDAQHQALDAKVERIVAAIEESGGPPCRGAEGGGPDNAALQARVTDLERANSELRAQAARLSRKTFSPLVSALLAKNAGDDPIDAAALDRALTSLSVEQRIAVKAEMARAGLIE